MVKAWTFNKVRRSVTRSRRNEFRVRIVISAHCQNCVITVSIAVRNHRMIAFWRRKKKTEEKSKGFVQVELTQIRDRKLKRYLWYKKKYTRIYLILAEEWYWFKF